MVDLQNGPAKKITIRVLKHDGTEYRRWRACLREKCESLLILDAEFDVDVSHRLLGEIKRGTKTIEYYWLDRWYSVFQFLEANGDTRLWYCNVNLPPRFENDEIIYVDLDIDVVVKPGGWYQVLDLDEFEANAEQFGYSDDEKAGAQTALDELLALIDQRQFPFEQPLV